MLNIYFEYWNRIVKKYNGTIDKYIGDAIMIIFGLEKSDQASNLAAECALEAYSHSSDLYEKLKKNNLPVPRGFGIGCH